MTTTYISSPRLLFREWKEEDKEELFAAASDREIGPMAGWQPHRSVEESLSIIKTILSEENTFAIIEKESGKIIGSVGLFPPVEKIVKKDKDELEVGYWIAKPKWGRGYATESVKRMLEYAFETLKINKVWCGAFIENTRSIRVQEKCGFVFSHIEEIHVSPLNQNKTERFSYIDRETWEKNKQQF